MAARKNRPIHDVTVNNNGEVLKLVMCEACMAYLKVRLNKAETIISSIVNTEVGFECEAGCSR